MNPIILRILAVIFALVAVWMLVTLIRSVLYFGSVNMVQVFWFFAFAGAVTAAVGFFVWGKYSRRS